MADICNIVIENPDTANIKALFVRRKKCWFKKNITEIVENAMLNIPEDNHPIIKKTIFEKIFLQMPQKYFHSKFIGCIYKEKAEVLVTSANFTSFHFDIENYESVVYHEMTKAEFIERFLVPLGSITEKDPSILTYQSYQWPSNAYIWYSVISIEENFQMLPSIRQKKLTNQVFIRWIITVKTPSFILVKNKASWSHSDQSIDRFFILQNSLRALNFSPNCTHIYLNSCLEKI